MSDESSAGGMLSGILEDEDGWLVAQLTTNQNETIGFGLRSEGQQVDSFDYKCPGCEGA